MTSSRLALGPVLLLTGIALLRPPAASGAEPLQVTNLSRTAEGWLLSWEPAPTGTAYTVQFQDTLADGIWRVPASEAPFPVATNQWLARGGTNSMRFYRVAGVPAAERGKILSTTLQGTYTTEALSLLFNVGGVPITPQYGVQIYKVVYETITPLGARTRASGALALPLNAGQALPLVSYQHGTITLTNDAPSRVNIFGESEAVIGIAFASTGYAAAVPDYLGLGDSPGLHPYHHARSEATACVDMLRASRNFCATNGVSLNDRLFLCGYSQGGHATMALLRELETFHTNEFNVTACAPMAGAYDLSGVTAADFLSARPQPNPHYFLYLLASYQEVYHLAPSLADLLVLPYATNLPPKLGGNFSGGDLDAAMPPDPTLILKPEYLAAFLADPRHPLRLALEDNDLYRWKPRAPMRMFHCAADQDVLVANSQVAYASFQALGASQVQLIDPLPTADYGDCVRPSLLLVKTWFDSLK